MPLPISQAIESYRSFASNANEALFTRLRERISGSSLVEHLATEISLPGKLLRPSLTLASFLVFSGGRPPNRECLAAAHALEIFHSFVLIHDDVIDGSEQRRNRPTLQRRIEKKLGVPRETGGHLAIVLGDILFGYAIDLLSDQEMNPDLIGALQRHLAEVTEDTGLGEARELTFLHLPLGEVSREQIEQVYYFKTTRYTIEAPLWLGARAAGIPPEKLGDLANFARPIGLGFQLENDLHEAALPFERFKNLAYDFQTGVKTLFLRQLYEDLDAERKQGLVSALADCRTHPAALKLLHDLVHSTDTLARMKEKVDDCFSEARNWIPASRYSDEQKAGLQWIADHISSHRKHSEAAPQA